MRERSVHQGARRRRGHACLIRVIAFPAFLSFGPSSICRFWSPERICSDLHSQYLEVHVRLFCKNSPEHAAEIKVQRKQGSGFSVRLGWLGRVWEQMHPSRVRRRLSWGPASGLRTSHIFRAGPRGCSAHLQGCWEPVPRVQHTGQLGGVGWGGGRQPTGDSCREGGRMSVNQYG